MEVVFVVALALEIAGGALLASETITSARGTFPSAATPEEQLPRGRAMAGFGLLVVGFLVQLAGYAFDRTWLFALAIGVAAAGWCLGRVAEEPITSWLLRRHDKNAA